MSDENSESNIIPAVIIGLSTIFAIVMFYRLVLPIWPSFLQNANSVFGQRITDPTYAAGFSGLGINITDLLDGAVVLALILVALSIFLVVWRFEPQSEMG